MKCFEHAKKGQTREAVGVCMNCGAGLCMEHVVENVINTRSNQEERRILCQTCAEVPETQRT